MSNKVIHLPGSGVPEYFIVDTDAGHLNPRSLTVRTQTVPDHGQGWRLSLGLAGPAGQVALLLTKEDAQRLAMNIIAQTQED